MAEERITIYDGSHNPIGEASRERAHREGLTLRQAVLDSGLLTCGQIAIVLIGAFPMVEWITRTFGDNLISSQHILPNELSHCSTPLQVANIVVRHNLDSIVA